MTTLARDEWTQDSVWYNVENKLKAAGISISAGTRKYVKTLIRSLCAEAGVTRESIGIIAAPRCTMYFDGEPISVGFERIDELAQMGTDIVFIEKLDTVKVLSKYASEWGVALVNSQGHLVEYGKDLINAANASGANLGIFTDDDQHGHMIADEAPGEIVRLGVDDKMLQDLGLAKGGNNTKIDGVLAAVGGESLWEYLMGRLGEEYPTRNYTRVIEKPDLSKHDPKGIRDIRDTISKYRELITSDKWEEIESGLEEVEGFIHVNERRAEIDEELGAIVEKNPLLKELALKLEGVTPILDKINKSIQKSEKQKQKEKDKQKEKEEKERETYARDHKPRDVSRDIKQDSSSQDNNDLFDIEGVGPTTARKFKEEGFHSALDIAFSSIDRLVVALNCSKETALSFINAAKKVIDEKEKGG